MSDPNNPTPTQPQQQQATQSGNVNWFPTNTVGNYIYYITAPIGQPVTLTIPQEDAKEIKKHTGGCSCKKCREFNEYAEPNQEDGTFICYSCRRGF